MKDGKNMRKKLIAAMMAGVLSAGMFSTGVFAADTDLKGEVNTFIAASLSNAMEEIQKDFNETYPDVEILYNADSSGTLQTQIEEGARCDIFFSAADKQMNALVDENLAKKDTVEDILENKVVLIKPKDEKQKLQDSRTSQMQPILHLQVTAFLLDSIPEKFSTILELQMK